MADIKAKYGASNQAITITINSLTNDAKRESGAVNNSVNCFLDALVQVKIATNTASDSTGDKSVYVYAYGSADGKMKFMLVDIQDIVDDRSQHASLCENASQRNLWKLHAVVDMNDFTLSGFQKYCK